MTMGEYIKQLRIERGLTQGELGRLVGVNAAAVNKWEKGRIENIKRATLIRLSDYFDVAPNELMCWENKNDNRNNNELKDYIKAYRDNNNISMRQFAIKCNLSHGAISILEKGINPATGEKINPTITVLKKLADGMNITLTELMSSVDDMPIDISEGEEINLLKDEQTLIENYRSLNDEGKEKVNEYVEDLIAGGRYKKISDAQNSQTEVG